MFTDLGIYENNYFKALLSSQGAGGREVFSIEDLFWGRVGDREGARFL